MIFSVKLSKKALKRFEKLDHKTRRRIRLKLKEFASDPFSTLEMHIFILFYWNLLENNPRATQKTIRQVKSVLY